MKTIYLALIIISMCFNSTVCAYETIDAGAVADAANGSNCVREADAEMRGDNQYARMDGSIRNTSTGNRNQSDNEYRAWNASLPTGGNGYSYTQQITYNNTANFLPDDKIYKYDRAKACHELAHLTITKYKSQYDSSKYDNEINAQKLNFITLQNAKISINDPLMKEITFKLNRACIDKSDYNRKFIKNLMMNTEYKDALIQDKNAEKIILMSK